MELEVVDFSKCSLDCSQPSFEDLQKVGEEIYKAFSTIGFVYLKNTGVLDEEAAEVHRLSKKFFDLDNETKNKYTLDENLFGYIAAGVENVEPSKPAEYKEVFDVSGAGFVSSNSKWPDQELPGFSDTLKAFTEKLYQLSMRILQALSIGMKVKDLTYLQRCHSRVNDVRNVSTLRSVFYPKIPDDYITKEGEMRLGEHSDWGSFSILFQDFVGGLQVMRQDGTFIEATPIPGTALVNIGDCLEFWTRGRLKSTVHRIPMPDIQGSLNRERSSLIYFIMPDNETELSEIECEDIKLASDKFDHPLTTLDYMQRKYAESNLPIPY